MDVDLAVSAVVEMVRASGRGRGLLRKLVGLKKARELLAGVGVSPPCAYLGLPVVGSKRDHWCEFDGHEFAQCTPGVSRCARVKGCDECRHWSLGQLHLIHHCLPTAGTGVWQRNVDHLLARLNLFTGRRVIGVATGPGLDPPAAVWHRVREYNFEMVVRENDPGLREVATWDACWGRVLPHVGPADAVFWSQSKGASKPFDREVYSHPWADLMYGALLDYPRMVAETLRQFPVCGIFKTVGKAFPGSESLWHYGGSFFWVRGEDAKRVVGRVDRTWFGAESFPGLHWRPEHGACLFGFPHGNLYLRVTWEQQVLPEWRRFQERNALKLSRDGVCPVPDFWTSF